jgi:uncharacterized protein YbjT (DUF2867 family)
MRTDGATTAGCARLGNDARVLARSERVRAHHATALVARAGAYGAFLVEDFWSHRDAEREIAQAHNLADAAKAAGVSHAVYSTLDDSREHIPADGSRMPVLQRRFNVPHYDAKAEACARFRDIGLPCTFLVTSIFFESFTGEGPVAPIAPQRVRGPDGAPRLRITFPMGRAHMPAIAVGDIGRAVVSVLKQPEVYLGQTLGLAGDALTGEEMAAAFTRVLGIPTEYVSPSFDEFRNAGFPGAEELANQFQFWHDAEAHYCGIRDPATARRLVPGLQTFEAWLGRNKHRFAHLLQEQPQKAGGQA